MKQMDFTVDYAGLAMKINQVSVTIQVTAWIVINMNRKRKDQYSDDNCICQAHRINSECVRHGTKKD